MADANSTFEAREHWESVYRRRSERDVSWFQPHAATSLRLIRRSGLGREEPLIDVGAGASVLVDELLQAGFRDVTVLDISDAAEQRARERLCAEAARVTWLVGDVTTFQAERSYALWHDRALFHFMTSADQRTGYVRALHAALRPGGQAIIATFAIGGPRRCSGLDIVQYDAPGLLAELGPAFALEEQLDEEHVTPSGGTQLFSYFRLRRR